MTMGEFYVAAARAAKMVAGTGDKTSGAKTQKNKIGERGVGNLWWGGL